MNERMTWEEIKKKYPHQNVGLINVEYTHGQGSAIRSAVVSCTENEIGKDEMAKRAIEGKHIVRYTTFNEDFDVEVKPWTINKI